jgi:hypothetical protein
MRRDELNDLAAFAVVAEEGSFTRAASRLGMSQPALSHAMRGLEERLKVRLLARTTRSVSTTEAGDILLRSLRPALEDIAVGLAKIGAFGHRLRQYCREGHDRGARGPGHAQGRRRRTVLLRREPAAEDAARTLCPCLHNLPPGEGRRALCLGVCGERPAAGGSRGWAPWCSTTPI